MKLIAVILLLVSSANSLNSQECKCRSPEAGTRTHTGYGETVLVKTKGAYKKLAGVVSLDPSDAPVEGVLVELFRESKQTSSDRTSLSACVTGPDGGYCFANVSKGRYELRVSKDGGFKITHVEVLVDPSDHRASDAELGIPFYLGQ